jgi:NIMA-interacting peptidyl-prolyl cis-trans isomerase 4
MAPKGKDKAAGGAGKGKGKGKDASKADDDKGGASKVKGAQQINVRHILCEKHARKEEVVAKLRDGAKFDEVAREMSEDKARAGV